MCQSEKLSRKSSDRPDPPATVETRGRRGRPVPKASAALVAMSARLGRKARLDRKDHKAHEEKMPLGDQALVESPVLAAYRASPETEGSPVLKANGEILVLPVPREIQAHRALGVYRESAELPAPLGPRDPVDDAGLSGLHRDVNTSSSSSKIWGLSSRMGR